MPRMKQSVSGDAPPGMALRSWADWPGWSEMLGGRFLYQPGEVRGRACLDSGYKHDVDYEAVVVADPCT